MAGRLRGLGRRPRRLGRDRLGGARGGVRRAPLGRERARASWTPSRPACCSRRRSAASATGSTRSSSASRPTCRGASRSTPSTASRATRATDLPPDLPLRVHLRRPVGVGVLLLVDRRFRFKPPALFALYVSSTRSGASSRSSCGSTPRTSSAGLRLNAWVSIVVFVGSTAFFVWWQFLRRATTSRRRGGASRRAPRARRWRSPRAASVPGVSLAPHVRCAELELDLDAFEGPFDLLLTLILQARSSTSREVDVAGDRPRLRRAARGARGARPRGLRRVPRARRRAARAEGARALPGRGRRAARTSSPRRPRRSWRGASPSTGAIKEAARLARRAARRARATATSGSGRRRSRRSRSGGSRRRIRRGSPSRCARSPPSRRRCRWRTWSCGSRRSSQFLERFRARPAQAAHAVRSSTRRSTGSRASSRRSRSSRCWSCGKRGEIALEQAAPFAPIRVRRPTAKGGRNDTRPPTPPNRRQPGRPARADARGAARRRLAAALRRRARRAPPTTTPSGSRRRSALLGERFARGPERDRARARSRAAGRSAPRARPPRRAGGSFERPVERGLSGAALETLAIVAYLGPVQPPGDRAHARRRGRLGRRGTRRARADRRGGARRRVRWARCATETTPLFERVFGLEASRSSRGWTTSATTRPRSASASKRSPSAAAPSPSEPADDLFGLVARERAQRLGVLGAVSLELHQDLGGECRRRAPRRSRPRRSGRASRRRRSACRPRPRSAARPPRLARARRAGRRRPSTSSA